MQDVSHQDLSRLHNAIEYFREATDPELSARYMAAIIYVSLNPGVSILKMGEAVGASRSAASRIARLLSVVKNERLGEPMDLLVMREDPKDARMKNVELSPKGARIMRQFVSILNSEGGPRRSPRRKGGNS